MDDCLVVSNKSGPAAKKLTRLLIKTNWSSFHYRVSGKSFHSSSKLSSAPTVSTVAGMTPAYRAFSPPIFQMSQPSLSRVLRVFLRLIAVLRILLFAMTFKKWKAEQT